MLRHRNSPEKVRLKTNLIVNSKLLPMGSVVDVEAVPIRLRKAKYCEAYNEPKLERKRQVENGQGTEERTSEEEIR